jgi:glutaredoxin
VRLFSKPGCSACLGLKDQLTAKGVQFTIVDISKDHDGGMEIVDQGFRSVPVIERSGEYFAKDDARELVASL